MTRGNLAWGPGRLPVRASYIKRFISNRRRDSAEDVSNEVTFLHRKLDPQVSRS